MPQRKLAIFDIDGTIFRSSLFIELVTDMISHGLLPASLAQAYQDEQAAWQNRVGRYDDYLEKMVSTFMNNLAGLKVSDFEKASERVIRNLGHRTYRYTRDLIRALKPNYYLFAISGSPREMVSRFCQVYEFDDFSATDYEIADGRYTGQGRRGDIGKRKIVSRLVEQTNLSLKGSLGIGDTEKDISFLEMTDKPIAFNPSSQLFSEAVGRGWKVVVERKDVIYHYPN